MAPHRTQHPAHRTRFGIRRRQTHTLYQCCERRTDRFRPPHHRCSPHEGHNREIHLRPPLQGLHRRCKTLERHPHRRPAQGTPQGATHRRGRRTRGILSVRNQTSEQREPGCHRRLGQRPPKQQHGNLRIRKRIQVYRRITCPACRTDRDQRRILVHRKRQQGGHQHHRTGCRHRRLHAPLHRQGTPRPQR